MFALPNSREHILRQPHWQRPRNFPLMAGMAFFAALVLMTLFETRVALAAQPWPFVRLQLVTDGLNRPVNLISPNDGTDRLFVVEAGGRIYVIQDGERQEAAFLNIADKVARCNECGLLGLAFPPDFAENGYFFVNYTSAVGLIGGDTGDPNGTFDTVIARYRVSDDPNVADPDSEERLLIINQPDVNHNGGHILFGPDGYFYIGMGDGGGGGDPHENAQNPASLHGKILRIEVGATGPYTIPVTNPFTTTTGYREEIWAMGVRNPWRFHFDRLTGDLYVADVGQSGFEEVNYIAAGEIGNGGMNFGWPIMEGNACFRPEGPQNCDRTNLIEPVLTYPHAGDFPCYSVTGGFAYHAEQPIASSAYLFADFCSGRLWAGQAGDEGWESFLLRDLPFQVSSFGEDEAGNIYLVNLDGEIYQLLDPENALFLPILARPDQNNPE